MKNFKIFVFFVSFILFCCDVVAADLIAHFIDVGQGDCIFLQLPNGKNLLIDGGPEDEYFDAGKEVIMPYLNTCGVKELDAIVISHAHRDHIGGLPHIIKKIPVAAVYDSGYAYPSPVYEKLLKSINKRGVKYVVVREKDKIVLDPAVEISVLSPPKHLPWDDPNNNSVVLKITYKKISFLFTGDIEVDAEDFLIGRYKYDLESNILKVPHHGSKTSSTDDFLEVVNPEVAVIQCGRSNRFRHPHPSVVRKYKDSDCELYRNDTDGTVIIKTDGKTFSVQKVGFRTN